MHKKWRIDKRIWIVLVALIMGAFAAWNVQNYLAQKVANLESQARVPMRSVIVAALDLAPGDVLSEQTLATREFPKSWLPSVAIEPERFEQLAQQVLVFPVKKGEPLLWTHVEKNQAGIFSSKLDEGRRAITVAVDEINSIAGLIQPGDWIDLYVTFDFRKKRMTSLLLSRIKVLATGQQADVVLGNLRDQEERRSYSTITLDSSSEEAVKLIVARQNGSLTAVLRSPKDSDTQDRYVSKSLSKMLGLNPQIPKPSKKVPVIYGDKNIRTVPRLLHDESDFEDDDQEESPPPSQGVGDLESDSNSLSSKE